MNKENGVEEAGKVQVVEVDVDKSDEAILQLNTDKGFRLEWNVQGFRKLDERVWGQLKPENMRNYLKAEGAWQAIENVNNAKVIEITNPFNPIEGNALHRLQIRKRKGWHQTWKSPGRDLDAALMGPYKQIRKSPDGKKEEAGKESGEILKMLNSEGKVEAVAVECEERYLAQYKEWMSQQSRRRYETIRDDFASGIENLNQDLGKRGGRITPLDGEGRSLI